MLAKALDIAAFFCVTTDLYGNNIEFVQKWLKDRPVERIPAVQFLISVLFLMIAIVAVPFLLDAVQSSFRAIAAYLFSFFDFAWSGFSIEQARRRHDWFWNALKDPASCPPVGLGPGARVMMCEFQYPGSVIYDKSRGDGPYLLMYGVALIKALSQNIFTFSGSAFLIIAAFVLSLLFCSNALNIFCHFVQKYSFKRVLLLIGAALFLASKFVPD